MSRTKVRSMAILAVLAAFASARGQDGEVRPVGPTASAIAIPATPAGVVINGFTVRGARSRETEPIPGEAAAVPLTGSILLLLGKDKVGGNVQLFWSGGAPPYVLQRWPSILPNGGGTPLPNPPAATSYDDHVLFDGIGECWRVD